MEVIELTESAVKKLRRREEPAVLDLTGAKFRNYSINKIVVKPATKFVDMFPKNAVPVYILSPSGRKVLPAFVKNSRAFTSTEVMKRAMPTVIAANPTYDTHNIVHYSEGPIIQIGSFYPAKTPEILLKRYLEKAEEVTAFGWMLTDPKKKNVSAMEHFDPITMDIPVGTSKRRALQIQLNDGLQMAEMKDAPTWAVRRILNYDESAAKKRIAEKKRRIWERLKRINTKNAIL